MELACVLSVPGSVDDALDTVRAVIQKEVASSKKAVDTAWGATLPLELLDLIFSYLVSEKILPCQRVPYVRVDAAGILLSTHGARLEYATPGVVTLHASGFDLPQLDLRLKLYAYPTSILTLTSVPRWVGASGKGCSVLYKKETGLFTLSVVPTPEAYRGW